MATHAETGRGGFRRGLLLGVLVALLGLLALALAFPPAPLSEPEIAPAAAAGPAAPAAPTVSSAQPQVAEPLGPAASGPLVGSGQAPDGASLTPLDAPDADPAEGAASPSLVPSAD